MKALVKYAAGEGFAELRDIPEPTPGPGEVKCRVVKAGICGSDMHIYHGTMNSVPPVVMGHEFLGYITEIGENVTKYKPGDRVTAEIGHYVCGTCEYCRDGLPNMCINRKSMGYVYDGVFAEYVIIPERDIVLVPKEIDSVSGMLIEPFACCCRACFDSTKVSAGNVVLVIGPGPMGQMIAQICKANGATVVMSGTTNGEPRLALAKRLGADYTVNVQKEDLGALIKSITNNYGADIVFECSGVGESVNTGMELLRKRGTFVQFANHGKPITVNWNTIFSKELHVVGAMSTVNHNYKQAISLLKNGKVDIKPFGETMFKLDDWEAAFAAQASKRAYKVGFDISADEY